MENYMLNVKPTNYYYRSLLNNKIQLNENIEICKNDKKDDFIRALKETKSSLPNSNSLAYRFSYSKLTSMPLIHQQNKTNRLRIVHPNTYNPFNDNFDKFKNNSNKLMSELYFTKQKTLPNIAKYEPMNRLLINKYLNEFGIKNVTASFFNSSSKSSGLSSLRAITPKLETSKLNQNLIDHKKKQFMEDYYNKNSRFLNRRNKINITNLIHKNSNVTSNSNFIEMNEFDEDELNNRIEIKSTSRARLKKIFYVVLSVVKLTWNINKPEVFTINSKLNDNLFLNGDNFKMENELGLAEEAKQLLKLKVNERTGDNIKDIVFFINFVVPEFAEYPVALQHRMAQFGFYEEYEPERVIIRQGHLSEKCYFIISGSADIIQATQGENGEVKRTLLNRLKKGDTFGETGLINKMKRTATAMNNGQKPLCLMSFEKEHFFKIQNFVNSKSHTFDFLKTKVELFKKLEFPFEKLLNVADDYFTIFYRKNLLISDDSLHDRWFFVIKTGKAKVIKKVRLSFEDYVENFRQNRQTTDPELMRTHKLEEKKLRKDYKYLFDKYTFEDQKDNGKYAYLLIDTLKPGEMFGFPDMVLKDDIDYNSSYMLVSDGAECVLINKENFLRICPAQSFLKLRYFVQLYPTDEYFNKKYFHNFKWLSYKEDFRNSIIFHDPFLIKNF